jgi:hypothetical protein
VSERWWTAEVNVDDLVLQVVGAYSQANLRAVAGHPELAADVSREVFGGAGVDPLQ